MVYYWIVLYDFFAVLVQYLILVIENMFLYKLFILVRDNLDISCPKCRESVIISANHVKLKTYWTKINVLSLPTSINKLTRFQQSFQGFAARTVPNPLRTLPLIFYPSKCHTEISKKYSKYPLSHFSCSDCCKEKQQSQLKITISFTVFYLLVRTKSC